MKAGSKKESKKHDHQPLASMPAANPILSPLERGYKAISTPEREVNPAVVKKEPYVTKQLELLGASLMTEVKVWRDGVDAKGKPTKIAEEILPYGIGPNLLQSWPHILKLSDNPDAQTVANLYHSIDEEEARALPLEAFCYAAKVNPLRVLQELTSVLVSQGATASTLLTAVWHPKVVRKTIEVALTDKGFADRQVLHKATGFLPLPKGAQTIVNVNNQANVNAPTVVPLSSPESTIAMLAGAFNEARGLPPPPEPPAELPSAIDVETEETEDD